MPRSSNAAPAPRKPAIKTHEYTSKSSGAVLEVVSIADLLAHAGFTGFDSAKLLAFKVADLGAVVSIGKLSSPVKLAPPKGLSLNVPKRDKNDIAWVMTARGLFYCTPGATDWTPYADAGTPPAPREDSTPPLPA